MKHTMITFSQSLGKKYTYMVWESFVLNIRTQNIIDDFHKPKALNDISNLIENHSATKT